MHHLKKYLALLLLIIFCSNKNYAQKIDSLLQSLHRANGIDKSLIYTELAWLTKDTNYTKAIYYAEEALKIAENLKSQQDICINNNLLGLIYLSKNRLEESQFYFFKALSVAEELNDKVKTSQILNNLGSVYYKQLNYSIALKYYLEAYKIKQEIKDEKSYVPVLINIAGIYYESGDKEKAKEYYLIAEKEALRFSDKKHLSIIYSNLGIIFKDKDVEKAISYYQKSLEIKSEQKNLDGMAATELNIGALYLNQLNNLDSAEKYLNSSLEKSIKLENYDRINLLYYNLSSMYYKKIIKNHTNML